MQRVHLINVAASLINLPLSHPSALLRLSVFSSLPGTQGTSPLEGFGSKSATQAERRTNQTPSAEPEGPLERRWVVLLCV